MDNTKRYLKENPEIAAVYAQQWEELLASYPRLVSINSALAWQQFKRQHPRLQLDDNLWLLGPASLEEDVQKAISKNLEEGEEEKVSDRKQQKKEIKPGLALERISGTLVLKTQDAEKPVTNASITVTNLHSRKKLQTIHTDSRGRFETQLLLPDRYLLAFRHPDFEGEVKKRVINVKTFQPPLKVRFPAPVHAEEELPQDESETKTTSESHLTQEDAAAAIAAAAATAPLSEQEQAAQAIQAAVEEAPLDPMTETLEKAKSSPPEQPLGLVNQNGMPLETSTPSSNQDSSNAPTSFTQIIGYRGENSEIGAPTSTPDASYQDTLAALKDQGLSSPTTPTASASSAPPPLIEQGYLQQAEEQLLAEYSNIRHEIQQEVINERFSELRQQYTEQFVKDHPGQAVNEDWVFQKAMGDLDWFKRGSHGTRGQINPWGRAIETEIDELTNARFTERTGKTWSPEIIRKAKPGSMARDYHQPAHASGITRDEILQRARELRQADLKIDTTPALATHKSGYKQFDSKVQTIQAAKTPTGEATVSSTNNTPALATHTSEFKQFDHHVQAIKNSLPRQSPAYYEDGTPVADTSPSPDASQSVPRFTRKTIPSSPPQAREVGGNSGGNLPPRPPLGRRSLLPGMPGGMGNILGSGGKFIKTARFFAPGTPGFWALIIILILLLILIIILLILSYNQNNGDVTVHVTKTGPKEVPNPTSQDVATADPSDIKYEIKVSWTGGPSSIVVTDKIPDNTEFVSATGPYTYDEATRTVKWNITAGGSGTNNGAKVAPDGKHACVVTDKFNPATNFSNKPGPGEYFYECGHCGPIHNANDVVTNDAGGSVVVAVTDGEVVDWSNQAGGNALHLTGDDGFTYYYAHLKPDGLVTGRVKMGQVIGQIAPAGQSANNGVAHVHISADTGSGHSFSDPADTPMGPLLDAWCGVNVCNGRPNEHFAC